MDNDLASAAEQRAVAVAKLKRAASLPRMKDGRRPPMHVEAVSEGEKTQPEESQAVEPEPAPEAQLVDEVKVDIQPEVKPGTPEPTGAARKRRSRSRSRSRGSKDLKGKFRSAQSPIPTPMTPSNDSSPEDSPPTHPSLFPPPPSVISPIPSHFTGSPNSRLLMSPTLLSPESPLLYPGTSPPTPMLPTLEALQKGLFRSNSAAARMMAMQKLTGGTESYDPSFTSPISSPPPLPGKLGRNNTVSGGERSAARKLLFTRLGERIKEADGEGTTSGGEEKEQLVVVHAKRRRRRSARNSANAPRPIISDESGSVSPSANTPSVPPTPLPFLHDTIIEAARAASTTPIQTYNGPSINLNDTLAGSRQATPVRTIGLNHFDQPPRKRRSILIEDQDDEDRSDRIPPQATYFGLPGTPKRPPLDASPRIPHSSDAPSHMSTDSAPVDAIGVPVFLSATQRTPSRQDAFPSSPFTTPLKEKSRDEDEEEVLYNAEDFRRSPFHDAFDREISWIADPLPQSRMPIHDEDYDDEDQDEEQDQQATEPSVDDEDDRPPESPLEDYTPPTDNSSPRPSSDSKDFNEPETSPEPTTFYTSPTPSSVAALSNAASGTRVSDDSDSPQYPQRLSVASPIQSDRSPLTTEFELDDRSLVVETPSKRDASTWNKIKGALTRSNSNNGRRSRTNSIGARERRMNTDSSISRESGASLTSPKMDKNDSIGSATSPQGQQVVMQSSSASTSMLSLAPQTPPRSGVSPVPMAYSADLAKYQHAKLFPFPGMKKLEEQRNRARGMSLSSSTPDIVLSHHGGENDNPAVPSGSSDNAPSYSSETSRDRTLSHQASDTRLLAKYKNLNPPPLSAAPSSSSSPGYFDHSPSSPHSPGSILLKNLPTNREGVRRWLSAKKLFPSAPNSPAISTISSPIEIRPAIASKKPSLSDLLRLRKENDLTSDWEEITSDKSRTPTSTSGSTLLGKLTSDGQELSPVTTNGQSSLHEDVQKTPRASKIAKPSNGVAYVTLDSPLPTSSFPSTPEPWSSLSDYPHPTTSESSSNTSSQYSDYPSQGTVVLERLNEMLGRGPRSPMWASAIDDPPRKLSLAAPFLQVVNNVTVKDRFLFLFSDILVIAKPLIQDSDTLLDIAKPNPSDRKFIVKNVVHLRNLTFSGDRGESQTKTTSRNPAVQTFIHQFSSDPDHAISSLFSKSGCRDDPAVLALLLFKTAELDRARLGDYLSRRTSRVVLKYYLDSFGFTGLRIDKAMRLFLQSITIPARSSHSSPLEILVDSFASRWYEANAGSIAYDRDLAIRLARAIIQLNELLNGGISQESSQSGLSRRNVTARDFLEAFRQYDPRGLISDELLNDIYDSIRKEKLLQARISSAGGPSEIMVTIKRALPPRLTHRVQSEPVVLRIPQPDPHFTIQLFGQDLIFDPPVLTFTKSSEASFRVTGTSFGSKTISMLRSGPNALLYSGLPQSCPLVVERAFMRNTFQVAFLDHNCAKRKYMFSVADPVIRHEWMISLKREIEAASNAVITSKINSSPSPQSTKFYQAASGIAFRVLQETLISPDSFNVPPSASKLDSALQRLVPSPHNRNNSKGTLDQKRGSQPSIVAPRPSEPVRSKSRSRMYYRHGPGKLESDGHQNGSALSNPLDTSEDDEQDDEPQPRSQDRLWSGKDLITFCQQNSSIALVLAFLQVGAPDHADASS
ncbi:hypothetical protein BJ138DRAFT_1125246 [Hygrophoropsis aurantiaca]|uniref:Uncharacterized protein n=1 Tax=Hygrophoropsis aurantiaca TaxID=72124 RepID=A0ACB8AGC2_9AGAM|nr:hypothetical protein BJ138DRAFT_1125246 [Hygrophoropsis aurantiaca]